MKQEMGDGGNELCMVCSKGEDDDSKVETWVLCDMCDNWVHMKCLPPGHIYDVKDEEFVCHNCL